MAGLTPVVAGLTPDMAGRTPVMAGLTPVMAGLTPTMFQMALFLGLNSAFLKMLMPLVPEKLDGSGLGEPALVITAGPHPGPRPHSGPHTDTP